MTDQARLTFEIWWEEEKLRPPYSDPRGIAKAAWIAALQSLEAETAAASKQDTIIGCCYADGTSDCAYCSGRS